MTRSRPSRFVIATVLCALTSWGCDSTAKFTIKNIKFERIDMVSAFPAENTGGGHRRVCTGPASSMELNLNLVSSRRETSGAQTAVDRDQSIRPGDSVDRQPVIPDESVTKDIFQLNIGCVDAYPDGDILSGQACQGVTSPTTDIERVSFQAIAEERLEPISVALLIDQSGSMNGLVNPAPGDSQEDQSGLFVPPADFSTFASDFSDFRFAEASGFIKALNDDDKLVVYTFNESDGVNVACTLEAPDEVSRAEACFGTRRDIFLNQFSSLQGKARGRTPLWEAVDTAWEFLKSRATGPRHIVVIGDGPDTCVATDNEWYRSDRSACASVGFNDFKAKVAAERATFDINVSFVQFQAPAYREQDPRQWEIACETGGQYLFINSEDLSKSQGALQLELRKALFELRYTLAGSWRMLVDLPVLGADDPLPNGMPPGSMYGMQGSLRLLQSIFTRQSTPFDFSFDGNADKRLAFRKNCVGDDQCGGGSDCVDACGDQNAVCGPFDRIDGTQCNGSTANRCCDGACVEDATECPAPATP